MNASSDTFKHINTGGKHLLTLINDILDLSKIEAGRLQLTFENVSVSTSFAEVVDTMRPLAEKKSQALLQQAPRSKCASRSHAFQNKF